MAPFHIATLLIGFVSSPCTQKGLIHQNSPCQKNNNCCKTLSFAEQASNYNFRSLHNIPTISHGRPTSIRNYSRQIVRRSAGIGNFGLESTLYMTLLALQFACQPILTKKFTPKAINRSTVVMTQDLVKVFMTFVALQLTGAWSTAIKGWSIRSWLTVAGIPALLYSIQNFSTLVAYQNLPPLTFNVLNQTKTLSAALCCYIFMGKVQSKVQIMSLFLLFASACVIEKLIPLRISKGVGSRKEDARSNASAKLDRNSEQEKSHIEGVFAVLTASFISGLAGALTQKSLQCQKSSTLIASTAKSAATSTIAVGGRNSYLFTMEIAVASLCFMALSTAFSSDGKRIRSNGFFDHWTPRTLIPIITNAMGAILVGLVIKYAGAVKKGFALIFGLVLSGVLQAFLSSQNGVGESSGESRISFEQIVGGLLAAISLWMHNSFPAKVGL